MKRLFFLGKPRRRSSALRASRASLQTVRTFRTKYWICFTRIFYIYEYTMAAFEGMHLHLQCRHSSFPAVSRPDHRFAFPPPPTAPAVMAVARRAATPARVWRRLPYTTKKRVGICFDCFCFSSNCFLGYSYALCGLNSATALCNADEAEYTTTAFEWMHPHLQCRYSSFTAASRPDHRFAPSPRRFLL